MSKKTVLYTGAGISAAVIGQAARSGQNKQGWIGNSLCAPPTFTHHALGFLGRQGLVHGWVQQNHDGLPQKAGYPQELINEIHGSWFDPSNPVVKYDGTLHSRCYPWMHRDAKDADLVIVLGTSLSGLNADQVATNCARRSLTRTSQPASGSRVTVRSAFQSDSKTSVLLRKGLKGTVSMLDEDGDAYIRFEDGIGLQWVFASKLDQLAVAGGSAPSAAQGGSLGTVCINLQQTPHDGKMTLRHFGRSDDVLRLLLNELGFRDFKPIPTQWAKERRVLVPYAADGARLREGDTKWMWWDLRDGQAIRLHKEHNCQGSRQPGYAHIPDGAGKGTEGVVDGAWDNACCINVRIGRSTLQLGNWWLDAALRGAAEYLPVVNTNPRFETKHADPAPSAVVQGVPISTAIGSYLTAPPASVTPEPGRGLALCQTHARVSQTDASDGNHTNSHRWDLSLVGDETGRVAKVTFTLHPTFRNNVVVRTRPPFRCGPCTGWGVFDIGVLIEFKDQNATPLQTSFPLKWRDRTVSLTELLNASETDSSDSD